MEVGVRVHFTAKELLLERSRVRATHKELYGTSASPCWWEWYREDVPALLTCITETTKNVTAVQRRCNELRDENLELRGRSVADYESIQAQMKEMMRRNWTPEEVLLRFGALYPTTLNYDMAARLARTVDDHHRNR